MPCGGVKGDSLGYNLPKWHCEETSRDITVSKGKDAYLSFAI